MDRGHLQSVHMQQMIAESCPSWWNFNNMMRPPNYPQHLPNQLTNHLVPTNSTFISHYMPPSSYSSSSSCHDNQDHLPNSWSQLLLGGVVGEEDKSCISNNIENESLEKWEVQILPHHAPNESVKQENSTGSYIHVHGDIDHHHGVTMPSWSQLVPVSSPKSSCVTAASNLCTNMLDFSNNKTKGKRSPSDHSSECNRTATGGALKKARVQPSSSPPTFKVRKEKLGDRITALHQIVSPFGKTDTSSVLLEANRYIRFLQNQVEALSLPYLSKGGANMPQKSESNEEPKMGLRSRGLCLVPLSCTLQVRNDNSGDYCSLWGGFR